MSELNQRLIAIARAVADTKRRRVAVIIHEPKERQRVAYLQHDAERVDAMADDWARNPIK